MSPIRTRTRELDQACADAVELARSAAADLAGAAQVGPHVGAESDGDRLVTHLFTCLDRAYAGWRWAVTVARASRSKVVTVDECVLLPGPDSLLAPDWVPWSERVRPGDLGVGDLMPAHTDDERLVPVAALEGDDGVLDWDDSAGWEAGGEVAAAVGLLDGGRPDTEENGVATGRARVLSAIGRDATAIRWYTGDHGPGTPLAHAAPGHCSTCGFLVQLGGPLGRVFGACANEYAPDDGRVVSLDHGCGAHSEAVNPAPGQGGPAPVVDEAGYDLVDTAGVSMADTEFEPLVQGGGPGRGAAPGSDAVLASGPAGGDQAGLNEPGPLDDSGSPDGATES